MLVMGAVRRRKDAYARWLAALWTWMIWLCAGTVYLSHATLYILLIGPFIVRGLLHAFFNKETASNGLQQLVPPLALAIVMASAPAASPWLPTAFLLYEGVLIAILHRRLSRLRGLTGPGTGSRKTAWMNSLLVLTALLFASVVAFEALAVWQLQLVFAITTLLLALLSAWYFSSEGAYEPLAAAQKYAGSSLDQPEKYRILTALDHQLTEAKYALEPNASLAGLAKKVFASPHQLSQVINESKGMSFFDLMAYHRVQEAKKLLRHPQFGQRKVEEIGELVGYMSKSSFNTVFKKFTGLTPSQYRERQVRDHDVERRDDQNVRQTLVTQSSFGAFQIPVTMIHNFIKVYFRNLARNKAFTVINVCGLVIGLASALMIYTYLRHELSYDTFHERAEDIHRIAFMSGNPQTRTPHPMAQEMVREFPEVEAAVTLTPLYGPGLTKQSMYIRNPEKDVMFREPDGYAADSTFFDVFDFELLVGNEKEALKQVGGLIISESLAKKYFGDDNPLGNVLEVDTEGHAVVVTGIMKDVPANSHFHPNFIISYVTLKYMDPGDQWFTWHDFGHFNYLKLRPGTDVERLEDRIPDWLHRTGVIGDNWYAGFQSGELRFDLQPITDIHLKSHIRWELEANGNIVYIYILFAAIAFIIIIASINFINLTTARAFERAKEMGVRRTLGAGKAQVAGQFLSESIFTCFIALGLALLLSIAVFDGFRQLTGKSFTYADLLSLNMLAPAFVLALVIGVVAGIFPALAVSRIKAGEILKGKFVTGTKSAWLRKSLVVLQFTVSAILIFGSIILVAQVNYMEGVPLGYDDEQVLVVDLKSDEVVRRLDALKNEISQVPGVTGLGTVSNIPGTQFNQNGLFQVGQPETNVDVSEIFMDYDAQQPLNLQLAEGRWFSRSNGMDSLGRSYIINETAVRALGLENPVGTRLMWDDEDATVDGVVVGVVKDFHFQSLHVPIQPLLMTVNFGALNYLMVKLNGTNTVTAMEQIEAIYSAFDDKFGFEAFFLDQKNQQLYEAEKQALRQFNLFATVALALAAMGLVGLAYLMMVQRKKEVGVRKILGASVGNLVWQENLSFLKLIAVALLLGLPVAYLVMNEWLASFAYRMPVGVLPYVVTAAVITAIALVSITLAVLRTVLVNPSHALRHE